MKYKQTLVDIAYFQTKNLDLIYQSTGKSIFINGKLLFNDALAFKIWENDIVVSNQVGLFFYSLTDLIQQAKFSGKFFLSHFWINSNYAYVLNEGLKSDDYYRIDADYIIEKVPWSNSFLKSVYEDYFLALRLSVLSFHTLSNGEELWSIDLNMLFPIGNSKIYGRIILVNSHLYFYSTASDNTNATFCLDYLSGKVIRRFEDFAGNLYSVGHKLYVSAYTLVKILDTTTNQITVIDLTNELQPFNLQIHWDKSVFTEDGFMYFVDGHFFTTNRFGIVDLNKKKLIWHGELEISDGVNNNIQEIRIDKERVYVHCSDNTLHVFEK